LWLWNLYLHKHHPSLSVVEKIDLHQLNSLSEFTVDSNQLRKLIFNFEHSIESQAKCLTQDKESTRTDLAEEFWENFPLFSILRFDRHGLNIVHHCLRNTFSWDYRKIGLNESR
jgi:hypothetical protein